MKPIQQDGFTIVELVIAMTVFSAILLLVTAGLIDVMKIYRNGVARRSTQQAARVAMEDIVRTAREAYEVVTPATPAGSGSDTICLTLKGSKVGYYIYADELYRLQESESSTDCATTGGVKVASVGGSKASDLTVTKSVGSIPTLEVSLTFTDNNGENGTSLHSSASLRGIK